MTTPQLSELVSILVKICSDNRVAKLRTGDVEIIMDPRAWDTADASINALAKVMETNELESSVEQRAFPSEPVDRELLMWSAAK